MTANRASLHDGSRGCSISRSRSGRCARFQARRPRRQCSKASTRLGLAALPWSEDSRDLQARMEFVRAHAPAAMTRDWPAVDDNKSEREPGGVLVPWLAGVTRASHLARLSMTQILQGLLTHEQRRRLDVMAPTHFLAPTGSRIRIDYRDELAPVVAVRLQEVFGVLTSPRLAAGQVPVTFKLLSPAQRPVQITRDLATSGRDRMLRCARTCGAATHDTTGPRIRPSPSRLGAPSLRQAASPAREIPVLSCGVRI